MKEKRIVKETKKDGSIQYKVEEKFTLFGITLSKWDIYYHRYISAEGNEIRLPAIFETLKQAQRCANIDPNPIVKREEIKIK